ncbi:hypothetical protein MPSEU_000820100 [Mayamaea pseudoterrestris]|nr:hypothetical protein MPSEU_000820100 [Mayamaea pseudoterrestris]
MNLRIALQLCSLLAIPINEAFIIRPKLYQARLSLALCAELTSLRVSELKSELKDLGVDFSDCFDKESLMAKLNHARGSDTAGNGSSADSSADVTNLEEELSTTAPAPTPSSPSPSISSQKSQSSPTDLLQELGQKSVKELRQELASRNLRWAGMLEKKELVHAVYDAMQADALFSATGLMTPGQVCNMVEDDLRREIQAADKETPLLVDVYATWCGPCQLMAKELQDAAQELGSSVRIAKLDSDQNEKLAGELRVQGLPTLILFENGKEVKRMEGAIKKDQLIEWVVEE